MLRFRDLVCINQNYSAFDKLAKWMHERPILTDMCVDSFANKFLALQPNDRRTCFDGLYRRYSSIKTHSDLKKELSFLEHLRSHLTEEKTKLGSLDALRLGQHLEKLDALILKITES